MNLTTRMNSLAGKAYRFANQEGRSQRLSEVTIRKLMQSYYLLGKPPWDSGIAPPELVETVEGARALPPGRALDLGCGTGTNTVYLARHGWDVVGVDLVDRAIKRAKRKARAAGVRPRLLSGDVTKLAELPTGAGFSLLFDLSCYCGIPERRRDAYAAGVSRLAAPGATLLLFGYGHEPGAPRGTYVDEDDLRGRFTGWELVDATPGTNSIPTWWFTLRRTASG